MQLPFFKENKEKSEYYLALLLLDEKVSAVILESIEGKIKIVNSHEEFFSSSIEDISHDEFITTIDKAISTAEEKLPPNIETHKTVFGVKESWIEEETKKIKKEYLANLKKVCGSLNLSPIGFMVTSEAIAHFLQEEEGAPLSAIFVELGKTYANISLYRGGKIIEKVSGELEESAPATVDKILRHFTVPVLPARLILFYAEKTEKLSQQFISYQWSKSLPFLHMPQIMTLPEGFDAQAVTFGAATQMGLEVLDMEKLTLPEIASTHSPNLEQESSEKEQQENFTSVSHAIETDKDDVDFEQEEHQTKHSSHHVSKGEETNFGFIMDQDISEATPLTHKAIHENLSHPQYPNHHQLHSQMELDEEPEEETRHERSRGKALSGSSVLSKLSSLPLLSKIKISRPESLPFNGSLMKFAIPLGLLIILILGLSFIYFFKTKATVTLTMKPKMVEQSTHVTFSTTASTDFSKNIIAAKSVSTTVDGELSTDATGKKDTGDKAKGVVTLYNNNDSTVKYSANTAIKSSNGLTFLLDKDVSIASASGDDFSGTKPGTTQVNVTAKEIGTDSNLPSGTKFSVGDNVAAKNDNAFSGGTKKSIVVVSQADLTKLKTDLPKNLENKAREALSQKAADGETVLPLFVDINLEKTKFDKNVGDEAKTVTLTATVSFTSLAYRNDEFTEYAKSLLKNKYSQDIGFADKSVTGTVKESKITNEKEADTTTAVNAGLLPTINTDEVIQKLKGQSLSQAKETLNNLPQVIQSQIAFSPNIPFLSNLFPKLPGDISIIVKSE